MMMPICMRSILTFLSSGDSTRKALIRVQYSVGSDGTIYAGTGNGFLIAINPDGTLKWRYDTGGSSIECSPAIGSDGTIYFHSNSNKFYA